MSNTIFYSFSSSLFGEYMLSVLGCTVCGLAFVDHRGRQACLGEMKKQWLGYIFTMDKKAVQKYVDAIGRRENVRPRDVVWGGTAFQVKVWKALLRIPFGKRVSYGRVAAMIDMPKAVRAAANAVAKNPIAILVPCHRVIRATGELGGYRWGTARKKALLEWEASLLVRETYKKNGMLSRHE
jgi:O-6-methylguanine DNA methyltransferase